MKFLAAQVLKRLMKIVQLTTGFDRITEDNEHFAETTVTVLFERL